MIPRYLAKLLKIMLDIISCAFKVGKLFVTSQHGIVPYFNEHPPPHVERIMDKIPRAKISGFLRDCMSVWESTDNGVTPKTNNKHHK